MDRDGGNITNSPIQAAEPKRDGPAKHNIRLPFFVDDEHIGLGEVVRKMTYAIGVKPCSGCERRSATLNRWMSFHG